MRKRLAIAIALLLVAAAWSPWTAAPGAQNTAPVNTELPAPLAAGDTMDNPTAPWVLAAVMCWNTSSSKMMRCPTSTAGAGASDTNTPRSVTASDSPDVVTLGATSDAASSAGGTGSLSAKLRLMTTQLNSIQSAVSADACVTGAKQFIPINISTATTTELTASLAGASNYYYVCSINIGPVAGAQNIALVDDDTDGCGSVTSGLAGGTTAAAGWNIAANGGLALGTGAGSIARTNGTNRVICAVTSANVQTSGVMVVVAAP
jgi:hypothetical protein